jgi:hypothetical protein
MNVKLGRTKIELNDSEKELLYSMYLFAQQYHAQTVKCNDLSCEHCPLNLFCQPQGYDRERVIDNIITVIERHANGEE